MAEPALVALAGEDHAHRLLGRTLVDLALGESGTAVAELDRVRRYVGMNDGPDTPEHERFYRTKTLEADLRRLDRRRFFRTRRIEGEPAGRAGWFVDVFRVLRLSRPAIQALVAFADGDREATTDDDACRAERYVFREFGFPAAFGVPEPTAEAWILDLLGAAPQRSADGCKRELRKHLGLPQARTSVPQADLERALGDARTAAARSPSLQRFERAIRERVVPAVRA